MGGLSGAGRNVHAQLQRELMKRKKHPILHTYNKSFMGFAARLSDKEAESIAQRPGVVSVFPDRVSQLHTTRSKVIGARYYNDPDEPGFITTASDFEGHGTHVASIAAGRHVWGGASYNGLAQGTPRGGSPGSRIAVYCVCTADGCVDSGILKAFDDAIADGVDVLSVSLGPLAGKTDFATDAVSIGAFHAAEKGVIVVCSAGNEGPSPGTLINVAPWILTVAATTIDRDFEADIVLHGGNKKKGGGINFSGLNKSPVYPLVDGRSAGSNQADVTDARVSNCISGSLNDRKVKGKIVLCEDKDGDYGAGNKFKALKKQGAIGLIIIDNHESDTSVGIPGKEPPIFNILSGSSQACPHVSGLAAFVKSWHPTWSPSAIKSALMTTAIQRNNLHAPITTETGSRATPYDIGAGEINLFGPLCPGLIYETETMDYTHFLCNLGYNTSVVKTIASTLPNNFYCPSNSSPDLISNMNYPSILVSGLRANESKTVKRTVTNVGEDRSTYTASVEAPAGMHVQVVPNKLHFTKNVKKLSFQVTFIRTATSEGHLFGSLTWSNWKHKVRSPLVLSNE
ncbi:co(2)-response secreted protease [Phtheirospermum japonicum]|uniref:Co(2)-response secreted protease n=1 Tax=Phtheirospermum japonicum TaxID=374723 RepID=A0A830DAL1_9LAMI|nr:co(2)-response secreted protease [Phtheirospermum japonicum]